MIIEGEQYRIVVLIIAMSHEIVVTRHTLASLLAGLPEDATVSLLVNGGPLDLLGEMVTAHDAIRCHSVPENLGVAGGRNYLLRQPEAREADLIFILDNDVVVPTDYVENLARFLVATPEAGVVGAAVADFRENMTAEHLERVRPGPSGVPLLKITSAEIRAQVTAALSPERLFHLGMHPDYREVYFGVKCRLPPPLRRIWPGALQSTKNKENPEVLERISNGEVDRMEVSNLAGCSQAFRRSLIDEIGLMSEDFNPYGFEDADFCIRAMRSGRRNFLDTRTWLYHGTDYRHRGRRSNSAADRNQARAHTVLARRVYRHALRADALMLRLFALEFVTNVFRLRRDSVPLLVARLQGFAEARARLRFLPERNCGADDRTKSRKAA